MLSVTYVSEAGGAKPNFLGAAPASSTISSNSAAVMRPTLLLSAFMKQSRRKWYSSLYSGQCRVLAADTIQFLKSSALVSFFDVAKAASRKCALSTTCSKHQSSHSSIGIQPVPDLLTSR